MRTITFYSYKGGVGRSLLVANTARYLSILEKSVVALDFDLEAPGLHYKFALGSDGTSKCEPCPGVVDLLTEFIDTGSFPESLNPYAAAIPVVNTAGSIRVMRAGTAPQGDYWRKLSRIDWTDLFYGSEPIGTQFFLELRERIRQEFNPDFCLIDARTGITDMGGIATTVLPDIVVCLALDSLEHLEGLRAMMNGVRQTAATEGLNVALVPIISRVRARRDQATERLALEKARAYLDAPIRPGSPPLGLAELVSLHSEPLLDFEEQVLVGGKRSPHEHALLRDYLKLFSKIIPAEDVRPHVGQLIQKAVSRLLDDPDGAQSDLEILTTYCADEEAYRALLKLYQVRKAPLEKIIATAAMMWQLRASGSGPEPLIVDIVRSAYSEPRVTEVQKQYVEFAEEIWRSSGMEDARLGMTIAGLYGLERRDRSTRLLMDYIERAEIPHPSIIVTLVDLLRSARNLTAAMSIIDRFKAVVDIPSFHTAWVKSVLDLNDVSKAREILQDTSFRAAAVKADDPPAYVKLMKLAGSESFLPSLFEAIETAASTGEVSKLQELAEIAQDERLEDEFDMHLRGRVPERYQDEIRRSLQKRSRRIRPLRPFSE
ncbi:KGGVGR-motif variant AAA ATPase [Occallatibacter savannae]|uniref:KGGVGR-motif variant AAA ATPase n=1 Tax=Occallatibacter savannae TaxID=1002691 RepID=UPI000D694D48|nr:hypothetical protein [Occallatibacter savannae]